MVSPSAEQITGRLGLGAIVLLAGYLVGDRLLDGLFQMIESHGQTAPWGILLAVPTVVVSYVLGVLAVDVAQLLLGRLSRFRDLNDVSNLVVVGNAPPLLQAVYSETIRRMEILQGATVAFFLLAWACFVDRKGPGNAALGLAFAAVALGLCGLSGLFAGRAAATARRIVRGLARD